ncbi:MAG: DUF4249 domain-containing protein [Calditrichaeota bacterium]|nr:DUF4249 domain-containing protein [Calditrichota bacterium]
MKKIIQLCLVILQALSMFSCEEVIDIDLNDADPKIVIEGTVTDQPGPYTVGITKTTDYYNPRDYPTIKEAQVSISDDSGFFERLTETTDGIYQTDSLQGMPGRTYTLTVQVDGQTYTATSTMQPATEIDSLFYRENEGGIRPKDQKGYDLVLMFIDTPGVEDFKRLKVYRNHKLQDGYFLYNGRLSDGNEIEYDRIHVDFEPDDFVYVELLSIDEATYEYYSTLDNAIASSSGSKIQTKVPANPKNNISGDALGYFGAFTVRSDSIVIK